MQMIRIAGHRYSDPDIISLVRATGELIDPRFAVISQARELCERYRSFPGTAADPLKRLQILASLCGLEILPMAIEQRISEPRDAVLVLNGKKHGKRGQILFNPLRPQGRVAFTIAHEIAHTFFPNSTHGARFRQLSASQSREANELERLCDLGAAELLMPQEEFQAEVGSRPTLEDANRLAELFGSSFEATVFRLASSHAGIAVAGSLRYRLRKSEEQTILKQRQRELFRPDEELGTAPRLPKYRRQSFFASQSCGPEFSIPWNKSFGDDSCVCETSRTRAICERVEQLPNRSGQFGLLQAIQAPYQRDEATVDHPDVLFFWSP